MDALVQWDPASDPEGDLVGYNVFHAYGDPANPAIPGDYFEFFTVAAPGLSKSFTGLDDFRTHHFNVTSFDEVPNESALGIPASKRVQHRFTMK